MASETPETRAIQGARNHVGEARPSLRACYFFRMRFRIALFSLFLAAASVASVTVSSDAQASVSIAVQYDALLKDADSVAVIVPQAATSVWEDGRIYTYTKLKIEQSVAGDVGTGGEVWVRTMGGVVGKIGQLVDGEPVFVTGKSSLVFLRKFKSTTTYEVSARAQGQFPITIDEHRKIKKVIRSANVGVLFPPKTKAPVVETGTTTQSNQSSSAPVAEPKLRLAGEMIHDRALDEVAREIAADWKRLHTKQ